jgi:hypothetical protein
LFFSLRQWARPNSNLWWDSLSKREEQDHVLLPDNSRFRLSNPTCSTERPFYSTIYGSYLYYYIKHLRIGGSIFCHCKFLLYPFYPSIRRIIFIVDWSNVCDRVHWSPLSLHFFPLYTIISIIFIFYLETLCIFGKKLMVILYVRIIYFSCHKNHDH